MSSPQIWNPNTNKQRYEFHKIQNDFLRFLAFKTGTNITFIMIILAFKKIQLYYYDQDKKLRPRTMVFYTNFKMLK